MEWPWLRLGRMLQGLSSGGLGLSLFDSNMDTAHPVSRPFVGGSTSGFHSVPRVNDLVLVAHEVQGRPIGMISVADLSTTTLPVLNPGESGTYHNDGRIFGKLLNSGSTTLWSKGTGSIVIDSNGRMRLVPLGTPLLVGNATNLGAGSSVALTSGSSDLQGSFTLTTDPTTVGPGTTMASLGYSASLPTPKGFTLSPKTGVSVGVGAFLTAFGTSSFNVQFTYTPAPNTTYSFSYEVIP